jgi:hypothetical protein
MNKFLFKSADADFQKLFQLQLTIQKNVLYITHRIDLIVRELNEIKTNNGLQKQVDQYFEDSDKDIPEDTVPE